jgi:hypothetical protein
MNVYPILLIFSALILAINSFFEPTELVHRFLNQSTYTELQFGYSWTLQAYVH